MKKLRILSLDGGGIRGIIPATILKYVEEKIIEITNNPNSRIADFFDIIVGTSTGGILSCFYLTPNPEQNENNPSSKFTAEQALEFYSEKGYTIFNASKRKSWLGLRQIVNATKYSPQNLENIFQEKFGELKMSELIKPCIVTTYDLIKKTSFFFKNLETEKDKQEFRVKDVARSTSAAPTYFPPAEITNFKSNEKMANIDGGVFANNPTMCAYAECSNSTITEIKNPSAKDMLILSIGTGGGQFGLPDVDKSGNWGVINWAKSIPEIMMDGSIDTVHYQMKHLFGTLEKQHKFNYKRVDVPLDKRDYSKDMADASKGNIDKLKKAGQEALNDALKEKNNEYGLDKFIELLVGKSNNSKPQIA
ncbi:MAG: patatin-like phospholipase family protein [Bacteroidota bacterium]|nr:patatin-like phospholipase family protein [Bacteroidota bacterium]